MATKILQEIRNILRRSVLYLISKINSIYHTIQAAIFLHHLAANNLILKNLIIGIKSILQDSVINNLDIVHLSTTIKANSLATAIEYKIEFLGRVGKVIVFYQESTFFL